MNVCPHCAKSLDTAELPVEPMYTLDTVAQLIPMTLAGLRGWLHRHKAELAPAVYARRGRAPRGVALIRLLTASEVRKIRQDQIRPRAGWWRPRPGQEPRPLLAPPARRAPVRPTAYTVTVVSPAAAPAAGGQRLA